ncbi:MAG: cation diffusion facilitator family transporter [Proteobacteria bacterium]|nr:cation diffusion facilitator family transporter [Pseudomonadota bacterium]MBU1058952.1 cation diffusion facilitator family transporter [Pseudomonadota bacterium]
MAHQSDSLKSIFYALGANGAIFSAKLAAALMTGSGAMLAEAIHSLADTGNQVLLLVGLKQAKRPPTPDYPLGFGKSIYFWSFIVALIMFSLGGMFSIYEGIHKLQHPEALSRPWLAVGVLVFSIVAESLSLWGCLREVNKVRGNRSLARWFRESRQSELLVVFGEDLAALLGLSFALVAVGLTMVTGNPFYDALGSIVIGGLLILIAILIGVEVKSLLIGQGVEPALKEEMLASLEEEEKIEQVLNLLTFQLGNDVMVAVKAKMQGCRSADDMVEAINACEVRFRKRFPQIMWLFFEPDNTK